MTRRWSRVRKLVIVTVLVVSGSGSLLAFLLGGGVMAVRTRLLVHQLKPGDVLLPPEKPGWAGFQDDEDRAFHGAALEILALGEDTLPTLLPLARAEVETDDAITFRLLALEIARRASSRPTGDILDLAADCLASREAVVSVRAIVVLSHWHAKEALEAIVRNFERRAARGENAGLEVDVIDEIARANRLPAVEWPAGAWPARALAARQWLEANRSHLPRQCGSR